MPDSDRSARGAVVVGIFAGLILCLMLALTFQAGLIDGKAIGENEAESRTYARHADEEITETCLVLEPVAMAECIRGVIEATKEDQRAQEDLIAQTEMSLWALGMLIVAGFTALITGVGVWFVKRTLDATLLAVRETAQATSAMDEANKIMRREQRPWLDFKIPKAHVVNGKGSDGLVWPGFAPTLLVTNHGKSPARYVAFEVNAIVGDGFSFDSAATFIDEWEATRPLPFMTVFPGQTVTSDQMSVGHNFGARIDPNGIGQTVWLAAVLAYVADGEKAYTIKIYRTTTDALLSAGDRGLFKAEHLFVFDRFI